MSAAATQFLPAASVRHIADDVVDGSDHNQVFAVGHMKLAMEADMIVVMPCSAATLSAVANGLADQLIPQIVLASPQPVIFLPSMNRVMWDKPSMQRNINQIRADGHVLPEPTWRKGYELADGTIEEHPGLDTPIAQIEAIAELWEARRSAK